MRILNEPRSLVRLIAPAIVVLFLAACGSNGTSIPATDTAAGSQSATSPVETTTPVASTEPEPAGTRRIDPRKGGLEVGFGEFAITLEAETIRPGPVTFVIRNGGALVHGFEIEAEDDDGDHSGPGNGELKLEGPEFGPNDVVRIRADLPAGVYEVECFVAEHDDMGMRATLVVSPDAPLVEQAPAAEPDRIQIADFAFAPADAEVPVGTEVTWTNEDPAAHTVTAEGSGFDSGTLDPGTTFSYVFDRPGTFNYACLIHPAMRGTVRVA